MYDFDRTFDRHNTEVIKWDRLEKDFGKKCKTKLPRNEETEELFTVIERAEK